MSLQVWLPLNGSLENLGLDSFNFTQSIASGYEDGKIGKALQMKNSNVDFIVPSLINAKEFSVAFWYKAIADESITTNWNKVIRFVTKNEDGTSGSDFRFESSYGTAYVTTGYALSAHNNTSQSLGSIGHEVIKNKGEWHHVCFTHTPTDNYTYLDGVQIRYGAGAAGTLTGRIIIAGNSPYPNGLMNDLRIYDHALSVKEVKELSKGLVAHYPLNDFVGNPNLVPNYGNYNSEENAYIWTTNRSDGYKWLEGSAFEVEPSTTYVYSVCSDGTLSNQHGKPTSDITQKYFSMWLYISNDGTTKNWQVGQYDRAQNFTSSNFNHVQEGNRHYWIYTTSATEKYMSVRINTYSDGETDISVKFWGLKLEKGSVATPWIPNTQDDLYSAMGLDENIIYDCSGYRHHGRLGEQFASEVTVNTNVPRYKTGINFGTGGRVYIMGFQTTNLNSIYSISCWIDFKNSGIAWYAMGGNNLNFLMLSYKFYYSTYDGTNNPFLDSSGSTIDGEEYVGSFHHYVITGDGTSAKLYIDGEYRGTAKTWKSLTATDLYIGTGIVSTANNVNAASDFRIYCTTLSAEDVKELYETSAFIDDKGNFHAYEISEV